MKINFDNSNIVQLQNVNKNNNSDASGIILGKEIVKNDSSFVSDNNTYSGQGMSVSDFKETLKAKDVKVTQDYMTVMSASMSDEDFAKFVQGGGKPQSTEVKDFVTIIDRIKLAVAKSGTEIKGFTDTLDKEAIEAMTGIVGMSDVAEGYDITLDEYTCKEISEAVEMLSDISEVTEGMTKDFVLTGKELTIDNLYLSKHTNCVETKEQGSQFFSIETPGYLAKKGVESDSESLRKEVTDLLISLNIKPDVETVENGIWLVKNSLFVNDENLEKLKEIKKVSFPMEDMDIARAIAVAISEGKNPKDAVITEKQNIYDKAIEITERIQKVIDTPFIKESRMLEETRLKMTYEANLMLLKSDFHIDTSDMEAYVSALKKIEGTEEFKEAAKTVEATEIIEAVKESPVQVIYNVAREIGMVSLEDIAEEGTKIKRKLEIAGIAYEQVGTQVRRDLGDSIKKAFRNIPDILESLGFEQTEENERTVRILGYNGMPINKESFNTVKEADTRLRSVLSRLTPADTLALIRENRSPIKMSVDELNEYLDLKTDSKEEDIEKYSKFLYKLERDKEITPEERADYIDVYRFITRLEKTGYAALGSVINAGRDLTFANMKAAMKTVKYRGMDVTVKDVFNTLVSDSSEDVLEKEWIRHRFEEVREAMKAPEETVTELVMNSLPVTAENLEAALLLREKRGDAFRKAAAYGKQKVIEKELGITDALLGKEEAQDAYSDMVSECKDAVYEECLSKERYVDVRELQLVHRQLSIAGTYAFNENYEVPIEIGGQVTAVNVRLVHNKSEEPNVVVSLETESLGRISARLYGNENDISGYIACNLNEAVTKMKMVADNISEKISVVFSKNTDSNLTLSKIPMKDNEVASPKELYNTAKRFLQSLRGLVNEN